MNCSKCHASCSFLFYRVSVPGIRPLYSLASQMLKVRLDDGLLPLREPPTFADILEMYAALKGERNAAHKDQR